MPFHSKPPRDRRDRRSRTSSQSSIDIQVTENETIFAKASAPAARTLHHSQSHSQSPTPSQSQIQNLVCPRLEFIHVLRTVGAKGVASQAGELFTVRQIVGYLREYIKLQQLYDPHDPSVVICRADPLGQVFGTDRFTLYNVLNLIQKNVSPAGAGAPNHACRSPQKSVPVSTETLKPQDVAEDVGSPRKTDQPAQNVCSSPEVEVQSHPLDSSEQPDVSDSVSERLDVSIGTVQPSTSMQENERGGASKTGTRTRTRRRKRQRCESGTQSERSEKLVCRRRRPTLSITYSSDGEGGTGTRPWYLTLQVEDTGGESEVLSVQSKETILVESSSDDLWFLDEDEEVEQISLQLGGEDSFSIELQTSQQDSYLEEYEVESCSTSFYDNDEDASRSAVEEIIVACDDSDIVFWADSESSDSEADTTDEELSEKDLWKCTECSTVNSPLCRYCDRCWKVRPGWLRGDNRARDEPAGHPSSPAITPEKSAVAKMTGSLSKTDALTSSPLHGAYFDREMVANSIRHRGSGRPQRSLLFGAASGPSSPSLLEKISTMPVAEKVNLMLEKSTPASSCTNPFQPDCQPHSPGAGTRMVSPIDHRVSILSREDSGIGMSQNSEFFPHSQSSVHSDHSNKESAPADLLSPIDPPVKASPVKSQRSGAAADICVICFSKPKEASIIHGKTGHQVCCYPCAKRLRKRGKPCPVCRRPIQAVIRNFML